MDKKEAVAPLSAHLDFKITPQPDDLTCGHACLHALYNYYGDTISLEQVVHEVHQLETGGTQAVFLGLHALRRGYRATIYTCNLTVFDPSWFEPKAPPMRERLLAQLKAKRNRKLKLTTAGYLEFLDQGGEVEMADVSSRLLSRILREGTPIITGLSATWLYRCKRERPRGLEPDDAAGEPVGHFVVVHGIDVPARRAWMADPYLHEPYPASHAYEVRLDRLIGAIHLGIVTYDAKLLVISPQSGR